MVGGLVTGALEKLYHQPSRTAWPRWVRVRARPLQCQQLTQLCGSPPDSVRARYQPITAVCLILLMVVSLAFSMPFVNNKDILSALRRRIVPLMARRH